MVALAFELVEDSLLRDFFTAVFVIVASGSVSYSDFLGLYES